jgi:hypothetical protein
VTKKKRRRRPAPLRQPDAETTERSPASKRTPRTAVTGTGRARPTERPRRPRTAQERRAQAAEWVHPPVAMSAAKGLLAVGGSPVLLIGSFLAVLGLWLVFSAYGVALAVTPGFMAMLESLPPVHVLFLDLQAVFSGGAVSPIHGLLLAAGLLLVRAALSGFWIALLVDRFDPGLEGPSDVAPDGWRAQVSRAARRTWRSIGSLVGIEAGYFTLSMLTFFLLSYGLGQLPVIVWLVGGLYFLVFAPIVAVVEGAGSRPAAQLAIRAARLPGPRHMMTTTLYVALALIVSLFAPPSRVAAATPSIGVWLSVLFVTFLNMAALATFTYRWLAIRERVLAMASEPRSEPQQRRAPAPPR